MVQRSLSTNLSKNTALFHALLPLDDSFDLITRDLKLGNTPAYWIGVNGFCKTEILQQIFSDLQDPLYTLDSEIRDLPRYVQSKLGYAQVSLTSSIDTILQNILSGPSVLLVEGFAQAVIIDVRTYPVRSISEPDTERITRGARDGFVETLLFNTNLIRRRVRSPKLTFSICSLGAESRTDVAIAYLADQVNEELLDTLKKKLSQLQITSLTMGSKSLEELLIKKRWWNPLPSIQLTERPDVACAICAKGIFCSSWTTPLPFCCFPVRSSSLPRVRRTITNNPSDRNLLPLSRFLCIPGSVSYSFRYFYFSPPTIPRLLPRCSSHPSAICHPSAFFSMCWRWSSCWIFSSIQRHSAPAASPVLCPLSADY